MKQFTDNLSRIFGVMGFLALVLSYREQDYAKGSNGLLFAIALLLLAILLK